MQKRGGRGQGASYVFSCLLLCGIPVEAWSQISATVEQSTSLGDWLVDHHVEQASNAAKEPLYSHALMWSRPLDRSLQEARWRSLLTQIRYRPMQSTITMASREGLYQLIASRQPTGRLPVKSGDGAWLQANPPLDPVLAAGDTVRVPARPKTVTLIQEDGQLCRVPYRPDAEAAYYINACGPAIKADVAWVAQPDGTVDRFKIAAWNRQAQTAIAPGAWIWAPDRRSGWSENVSERIGEFFATQPPSGLESNDAVASAPNAPASALAAAAPLAPRHAQDLAITTNDWGNEGLLQTPSARMGTAGEASISFTNVNPYTRVNVMLHPLDWFEFGFRYTDISNHAYGSTALSGSQSYKDKSIDAKVRLVQESAYVPQLALGMIDIGGTGLFSGEYLVASKRTGGFDWSLGLGWGYVGGRGDIGNPLQLFSNKFRYRPEGSGSDEAGGVGKSYFRGPMSVFGGVQYQMPNAPLVFKLEYDGNDYKHDPFDYDAHAKLPVNLGVVYRFNKNLDFSAGFERGNRAMLGVTLHGDLSRLGTQKVNDPARLPIDVPRPSPEAPPPDWRKTVADLQAQTRWTVLDIGQHGHILTVSFDSPEAFYRKDLLDRVATVLHRDAPADINTFRIVTVVQGQTMRAYTILRTPWVESKTQAIPTTDRQPMVIMGAPPSNAQLKAEPKLFDQPFQRFYYSIGPGYSQTLGGPNGFVLYAVSATANMALRLRQDTWIAGGVSYRLLDNYSHFTYTADSNLPRVRTYLREYMTTSRFTIPYLQATHVGKLGTDQYYSVYGGLLEPMFSGVGAEWLYRPSNSPIAVGVDVNQVWQRDFNEDFGLRHYRTFTGHLTAYWDTGWNNFLVKLSAGQYLAKDRGATLDISRQFQNGVSIGAYATKTNISSATFGEGSFDKGIYVQIPFDAIMGRSIGGLANLSWQPLTRDGGAKLNRQFPLYDLTDERSPKSLWYQPGADANADAEKQ
ncbi:MAG: YjbH domain-containing protein [Janthinobacterium lividum]